MMLAAYFDQYPAHLADEARRQAVVGKTAGTGIRPGSPLPDHIQHNNNDDPCPLHGHDGPPLYLLSYPLMASVPEEDGLSESGRTYTVSSNSEVDEAEDHHKISETRNTSPHCHPSLNAQHKKSLDSSYYTARESSPNSEFQRKSSDSYYTGRGSSPISESHRRSSGSPWGRSSSVEPPYTLHRESDESATVVLRSDDRSTVVFDPGYNSFIPRDPDCPVHSSRHGSLRCSPVRNLGSTVQPVRSPHPGLYRSVSVPSTPVRSNSTPPARGSPPARPTSLRRNSTSPSKPSTSQALPAATSRHSFPVRHSASSGRVVLGSPSSPPTRTSPKRMLSAPPLFSAPVTLESFSMDGEPSKDNDVSVSSDTGAPKSMAAESELLHCTICTQQFNNPKVLPCLHTFCEQCLLSTTPGEALTISCPECKQQSILPQAGVSDLQSNTWVQGVIDSLDVPPPPPTNNNTTETTTARHRQQCEGVHCCATRHHGDKGDDDGGGDAGVGDATVRCLQCRVMLCGDCSKVHVKESEHEDFEQIEQKSEHELSENVVPATDQQQLIEAPVSKSNSSAAAVVTEANVSAATTEHSTTTTTSSTSSSQQQQSSVSHGDFDDDTKLYCPSHEGMTLRFYCRDCDTAVCISCTDIEHRMHGTMRLSEAMHDQTNAMQALVDAVTNKVPALTCCVEDLDDAIEKLGGKKEDAEERIRDTFRRVREALDDREQLLIATLETKAKEKQRMLEAQKKELLTWRSNMEAGSELIQRAAAAQENRSPMQLVLLKKQFGDRLKEYVEADLPPGPRENTLLSFEPAYLEQLFSALKKTGMVVTNPAVPFTTIASGDSLRQATVGRKGHITVITRDFRGERVGVGGAELTATFTPKYPGTTPSPPVSPCSSKGSFPNVVTPIGGSSTASRPASEKSSSPQPILNGHSSHNHPSNGGGVHRSSASFRRQSTCEDGAAHNSDLSSVKIIDHNTGIYDVEFILHRPGFYNLDLCLYGMPIDQSPFTVRAVSSGSTCSIHGSEQSMESPFGPIRPKQSTRFSTLSSRTPPKTSSSRKTPSQRSSSSRVTLPIEDDLIMKVGIKGRNKGEFVNPQGICYSNIRGGRIVVTDSISQCVQVFTTEGEFKIRFGTRGRSVGQLQRPTGVGALPNGNYAIADYENKCVSIFEPNGKFVNRIGQGKLLGPKGVCADRHGNIIVVDNKGSCICIFQSNGRLLTKFGNRGMNYLNFAGPHFVAVDSQDHIIATDFHNHCVKVFDSSGEFLFTFGSHGEGNGQFNAPTGIAVDENDNIIVADWGNCRIQVFDCRGSFLSFVNTLADPLHGPQGLTYTADGHIVVADSGNHCYKVYKYLQ